MIGTAETITVDEVANLLRAAVARDQRTVGRADLVAWWQDLNAAGVTYAAASEAMVRYHALHLPRLEPSERRRVTAAAIIAIVYAERRRRIEAANYIHEPNPDETPRGFLDRYRSELAAVADGSEPPARVAAVLARPVAELVAAAAEGTALPAPISDALARVRTSGRNNSCPQCGAAPRRPCTTGGGRSIRDVHPSRVPVPKADKQ